MKSTYVSRFSPACLSRSKIMRKLPTQQGEDPLLSRGPGGSGLLDWRRRRLLLDDFDHFAGISLFLELQDEVFSFDWVAFIVELDRTRYPFKVFDLAHRGGDVGAVGLFAAIRFDPLFHRLDSDHCLIVAVEAEIGRA